MLRRLLLGIALLIVTLVLVVRFGSGMVAEKAASKYLAGKNVAAKTVRIQHASLRSALVSEAVVGTNDNVATQGLSIDYGYRDGALDVTRITADTLQITGSTADGGWDMGGVETLLPVKPLAKDAKDIVRFTAETALDASLRGKALKLSTAKGVAQVEMGDMTLDAKNIAVTLVPSKTEGSMDWTLKADTIVVTGREGPLTAALNLSATGTVTAERIEGQGTLADKGRTMPLILRFAHGVETGKTTVQWTSNTIKLTEKSQGFAALSPLLASIPPMDAELRMQGNAVLEKGKQGKYTHLITVDRAAMSPLLKLVLKDDVAITGDLSGTIPLAWSGEKIPQIKGAELKNTGPGTLVYDPLTGASAQLQGEAQAQVLLDALRKFQYKTLDISASSDKTGALKSTFHLIGANPDLYGGKSIDFTLNVNGNLLSILESQQKVNDVIDQSKPK